MITGIVVGVVAAFIVVFAVLAGTRELGRRRGKPGTERILVPFTGGTLEPTVLNAAIRLARAEKATLVPAYLLVVPLRYPEDSPLAEQVAVAMPLLEAVEHAAQRAGVAVDARIEKGRTPTHALRRLWSVEHFDRIVAPAPANSHGGLTTKDLTWILTHAPAETIVLKPAPPENGHVPLGEALATG